MIINKNKIKYSFGAILLASSISQAHAADINVNGFASIRAGQMIDTEGNNPLLPNLYNDSELSFTDESLFALQFSSNLGEGLSATVQLMSEGKNEWNIEARWAYLAYELNEKHTIKAGRFANPLFYNSEYEKVGFTHNFARLPKSVYWGYDFSTIDGISLDSNYELGDYYLTTKVLYGSWEGDIKQGNTDYNMSLENSFAVNFDLNKDWWNVFGGVLIADVDNSDVDNSLINPSLNPYFIPSQASQSEFDHFLDLMSQSGDGSYIYGGFKIDYNNWLIDAEVANFGIKDSSDAINTNWYFAIGKRFNEYVVTLHHEEVTQKFDDSLLDSVSNPLLHAVGTETASSFAQSEIKMDVVTVRWDFHPSAALKADYFMGKDYKDGGGDFSGFSVGVDLVF
jgi:hypothetical protein